jgi:hypothetical protein
MCLEDRGCDLSEFSAVDSIGGASHVTRATVYGKAAEDFAVRI